MKDVFAYTYDEKPIPYRVAKKLIVDACGYVPSGLTPWVHLCNSCDSGNARALALKKHFIPSKEVTVVNIPDNVPF